MKKHFLVSFSLLASLLGACSASANRIDREQAVAELKKIDLEINYTPLVEVPSSYVLSETISQYDDGGYAIENAEISRHIDQLAAQGKNTRRAHVRWIAGIAASILLLVSAGLYFATNRPDPFYQDTYDTPEEAYATTEKAITLLATNVNKGLKSIEQIKY